MTGFFQTLLQCGAIALLASTVSAAPQYSSLWGKNGEQWTQTGRLPDFSYAGYHQGEKSLPVVPQTANVKDFGAVGDGVADDTKAIQAAIDATPQGAIFIPAGRYQITDFIRIGKSHLVLRGDGAGKTVFWFPRGLDEVHPKKNFNSAGTPASGYSFDGAFLTIQGDYRSTPLAEITATSKRGENTVIVDKTADLKVGQWVMVMVKEDAAQSLKTYLYDGNPGDIAKGKQLATRMLLRVEQVQNNRVQFGRPLRFETRAEWQPKIYSFAPTVAECGIENIGFEFPNTKYRGHFKENGANAIELRNVTNCWVKNVRVHNGDMGVNIVACGNTVDGITITADPNRGIKAERVEQCTGHHGIQCKNAEDNLVTNFDLQTSYCHDLSVEHASGNVFAAGRGVNINFDHHKDTPYENLFTDIDCGAGTRVWHSGGGASLGRQSAMHETFWNIRAANPIAPPAPSWGVKSMNFVGLQTSNPSVTEATGTWFEAVLPTELQPANLYVAQLARRLKGNE